MPNSCTMYAHAYSGQGWGITMLSIRIKQDRVMFPKMDRIRTENAGARLFQKEFTGSEDRYSQIRILRKTPGSDWLLDNSSVGWGNEMFSYLRSPVPGQSWSGRPSCSCRWADQWDRSAVSPPASPGPGRCLNRSYEENAGPKTRVQRNSTRCGVTLLGCCVAHSGCGEA